MRSVPLAQIPKALHSKTLGKVKKYLRITVQNDRVGNNEISLEIPTKYGKDTPERAKKTARRK